MKYGDLKNHKMANNILKDDLDLYTIMFDSTKAHNNYISIYKNEMKHGLDKTGTTGNYKGNLDGKTLSNYVLYIGSRAVSSLFSTIDLNSLRLYNKAFSDEEIKHNYMYDKKRFGVE